MNKVSDKLSALTYSQDPENEVYLSVMLDRSFDSASLNAVVAELANLSSDQTSFEVLTASGMVLMKARLGAVERIAGYPAVLWVDKETEAAIGDLVDE